MDEVIQEILQERRFQEGLSSLASELGKPRDEVERLAVRSFNEMIARHDPVAVAAYKAIGALFSRRYRVDVDHGGLNRLRELDREHALIWLPSHRSYLDMFYLEQVAQEAGIHPAFVLGGDNLDL